MGFIAKASISNTNWKKSTIVGGTCYWITVVTQAKCLRLILAVKAFFNNINSRKD